MKLHFPDNAQTISRQAEQFRRLTPTERFLNIIDLIASGTRMLAESPRREQAEDLRQADETRWRQIHRELFARHGF